MAHNGMSPPTYEPNEFHYHKRSISARGYGSPEVSTTRVGLSASDVGLGSSVGADSGSSCTQNQFRRRTRRSVNQPLPLTLRERFSHMATNIKCAISFLTIVISVIGLGFIGVYVFSKSNDALKCPSTSFKCPSEHKCVSFRYLCDGRRDCLGGSDELAIHCSDLSNLKQMFGSNMKVNVTWNSEDDTDQPSLTLVTTLTGAGASNSCGVRRPVGCQCRSDYIFCENTNWSFQFDWTDLAPNTTRLALRRVFNPELKHWAPPALDHLKQLQVLAIEHHYGFANFTFDFVLCREKIGKLYMTDNGITNVKAEDFNGMPKLAWLFLSDNRIADLNANAFAQLDKLMLLELSYNKIKSKKIRFPPIDSLKQLYLQGNKLETIHEYMFHELTQLTFLNLAHNDIQAIHQNAFSHNLELKDLDLSRNKLRTFEPRLFDPLRSLTKLNLDGNPMTEIPREIFYGKTKLRSLNLRDVEIKNIDMRLFSTLTGLEFAHFRKFEYCRYVPRVPKCRPSSDGLSSVKNLLNGQFLRPAVWIVGVLTLVGNTIVLTNRCFSKAHTPKLILDIFINNLAAADALMGLYFVTIALKDLEYRNTYNQHAYNWTNSLLCTFVGSLALISREVSLIILTAMSMERFLVISGPYSFQRLTKRLAFCAVSLIWTLGTILGLVPVFTPALKHSFYASSGLCFSIHLNDPNAFGWEYSIFVFVGINTFCLVVTTVFYGRLFWTIKKTRLSTPVEISETKMAMRLFFMVLIDFFCWVPIIFMKLATLQGYQIQPELHAWVIIILLPLNAAINPLLYTFSTTRLGMRFVQKFISITHLGKYHSTYSYYDGTQFTATTNTSEDNARWSLADWKYDDEHDDVTITATVEGVALGGVGGLSLGGTEMGMGIGTGTEGIEDGGEIGCVEGTGIIEIGGELSTGPEVDTGIGMGGLGGRGIIINPYNWIRGSSPPPSPSLSSPSLVTLPQFLFQTSQN